MCGIDCPDKMETIGTMLEISRFFGIIVRMYYNDHQPPHFHACYGADGVAMRINPVGVLHGNLSPRPVSLVFEWALLHERELIEDWRLARAGEALNPIESLR
jgi:hypothetical protein